MNALNSEAERIFSEARALIDAEKRAAYLETACSGNSKLREEIESLLRAHADAGSFLGQAMGLPPPDIVSEHIGSQIGRYKLLERIGEGAFGVVFMAEQREPLYRKVALKVIKAGMDTREVVARFEAERQALALMDHPNIAKVLDAGSTDTGRPYFVMELVHGVPITEYCGRKNLTTEQCLRLFTKVCHAVQHAHQKGIIHRDLKPLNLLVALEDGEPVPKVIDFGIAKALGQKLTEKTVFTAYAQLMGTPAYMSPEQAELGGMDIDTRADIYSLGAILYELLTGVSAFDLETLARAGLDEVRRIIRETDPPKPSTRLQMLRTQVDGLAPGGITPPASLSRSIPGELDWIVLKAMEKDRNRRYANVGELALDLENHLAHLPVQAVQPTVSYRLMKFSRRNRSLLAVSSAFVLLLLVATIVSTSQAVRARRAERRWQKEAAKSQEVARFLLTMIEGARPSIALGRDKTLLLEMLDQASGRLEQELKNQPQQLAELSLTMGRAYQELGEFGRSETMIKQALGAAQAAFGEEHLLAAAALNALGGVLMEQNKNSEAEISLREALKISKALGLEGKSLIPAVMSNLGILRQRQGKFPEAEAMFRQVLILKRANLGNEHPEIASSLNNLGAALIDAGKLREGGVRIREGLGMRQKLLGANSPAVAESLNNLAAVLGKQQRWTEAVDLLRESVAIQRQVLPPGHPVIADVLKNLATALNETGNAGEAALLVREGMALSDERSAPASIDDGQFERSNAKIRTELLDAAKRGDTLAQLQLAKRYYAGEGVEQSHSEAFRWFSEAANAGNAIGQFGLATLYDRGEGTARDGKIAAQWFSRAADQGYALAQFNLGLMLLDGEGVPMDEAQAASWFRKAAEQGEAKAQCNLGWCYSEGIGVPKDAAQAVRWLRVAAEQGHAIAQCSLAAQYSAGLGVAKNLEEAVNWLRQAASQGLAEAQYRLGSSYFEGAGVETNYAEAFRWFERAAEQGHSPAQCNLGVMYHRGYGIKQDNREALKWTQRAAEQNDATACLFLGNYYSQGSVVPQDNKRAAEWYLRAAEGGECVAQANLAVMYHQALGVPQDDVEAFKWAILAERAGYEPARRMSSDLRARLTAAEVAKAIASANRFKSATPQGPTPDQERSRLPGTFR